MEFKAKSKGLTLEAKIDCELLSDVFTDDSRMRQILINLIANAIKFTTTGGITIKGEIQTDSSSNEFIKVSVTDTGTGIPEEEQG